MVEGITQTGEPVAVGGGSLRAHQNLPISLTGGCDYLIVSLSEPLRSGHLLIRKVPRRHRSKPLLEGSLREDVLPVSASHQPALRRVDFSRDTERLRRKNSRLVRPGLPAADNRPDVHALSRQLLQSPRHDGIDILLTYPVSCESLHPVAGDIQSQRLRLLNSSHTREYVRGQGLRICTPALNRYLDNLPLGRLLREPLSCGIEIHSERNRKVGGFRILPSPLGISARGLGEPHSFRLRRKLLSKHVPSQYIPVENILDSCLLQRFPKSLLAELRKRLRLWPASHISHHRDPVAPQVRYELLNLQVRVPDGEHRALMQ